MVGQVRNETAVVSMVGEVDFLFCFAPLPALYFDIGLCEQGLMACQHCLRGEWTQYFVSLEV